MTVVVIDTTDMTAYMPMNVRLALSPVPWAYPVQTTVLLEEAVAELGLDSLSNLLIVADKHCTSRVRRGSRYWPGSLQRHPRHVPLVGPFSS